MRNFFRKLRTRLLSREDTSPPADPRREALVQLIGIPIRSIQLYEQALRHRSILRGTAGSPMLSNERLEFLGDAVLSVVVSRHLYEEFPSEDEGFLTRLRSKLVNGAVLSRFARSMDLGRHIAMSENTESAQGRENDSILADAFEALIGALYLDLGYDAAEAFVKTHVLETVDLEALIEHRDNYKSMLLEYAQARGWSQPTYRVVSEEGPGHDREFTVEVLIDGTVHGWGEAKNKKKAEQHAARMALSKLTGAETADGVH